VKMEIRSVLTVLVTSILLVSTPMFAAEAPNTHCEVHQEILKKDQVEIRYGRIALENDYIRARQELFPHSNIVAYGGCRKTETSPKFTQVLFCQKCRDAEKVWTEAHQKK